MIKKTILIIEDEQSLLDSYSEVLTNEGYNVVKATDGYKGIDILKKNHASINLILLDLMMPGIDGLEVLRTIKSDKTMYGDVPVIILTNMTSDKVIKETFDMGAVSYLVKSELDYKDLISEVNKLMV
ncbi:MAG TPA: response regulator [Candidatus Dojkabacteria bacterium]|nr:response regulator [Candidatus Dojkabacteria bacterium]